MQRFFALLSLLGAVLASSLAGVAPSAARAPQRAGVVVQFGDGRVMTTCVAFTEDSISGFELLERSRLRLAVQYSAGNATVCQIEQEGCAFPSQSCFCECQGGGPCRYWAYWQLAGDRWEYSSIGASGTRIQNGDVDGWAWGNGSVAIGTQPPVTSFEQICAVPSDAAVATAPSVPTLTLPPAQILAPTNTAPAGDSPPAVATMDATETESNTAAVTGDRPVVAADTDQGQGLAGYAVLAALLGGLLAWIARTRRRRR